MKEKEEVLKVYENFIASSTIGYKVVDVKMVDTYPLLISEQENEGCCNRIAIIVIPTYKDKLLTADLNTTEDFNTNDAYRLISLAKHTMRTNNLNMPLMIAQCRLVYTPKSHVKQLCLNKWWLL